MSSKAQVDYARFVMPMKSGAKESAEDCGLFIIGGYRANSFGCLLSLTKTRDDLTPEQRKILKDLLKHELEARRHK